MAQAFCLLETQGSKLIVKGINSYTGVTMAHFELDAGDRTATDLAVPKW